MEPLIEFTKKMMQRTQTFINPILCQGIVRLNRHGNETTILDSEHRMLMIASHGAQTRNQLHIVEMPYNLWGQKNQFGIGNIVHVEVQSLHMICCELAGKSRRR